MFIGANSTSENGGTVSYDSVTDNITYTPALNFNGIDTFSYVIRDEYGQEDEATVNINVTIVDDVITGTSSDDTLNGNHGNDTIDGLAGNDILQGKMDNDILSGGAGNDTYIFNIGDGQDSINNNDATGNDKLLFGAGITVNDLAFNKVSNNLVVSINNTTDSITFIDWYANSADRIDTIEFDDGYNLKVNHLNEYFDSFTGTSENELIFALGGNDVASAGDGNDIIFAGDGNDSMWGNNGDDTMHGGDGNETFYAGNGNDTLYGDNGDDSLEGYNGNDTLYGGAGNDIVSGQNDDDIIDGGIGNDTLGGGAGNDTYIFNIGDGQDSINNNDATGNDKVLFGSGIENHDLWLKKVGDNMELSTLGTTDKVTFNNWFNNDSDKVDTIETSSGDYLSQNNVDQLISAMAAFDPDTFGTISDITDLPVDVQNAITANWA